MSELHPTKKPARAGRRPRGNDTEGRERLLDAAVRLFSERGIANTTVAQVAAASNVTAAMVHYWFDSRELLLDAVVDERFAPLMREIWQPAEGAPRGVLPLMEGLVRRLFAISEKSPWLPSLWLREIIQEGGELRERVLKRIPREQNIAFHKRIAQAQAQGEVNPDIWPEVIFLSILGLVMLPHANSRMWNRMNPNAVFDRQRLERHIRSLLFNGLSGNARSRSTSSPKERS